MTDHQKFEKWAMPILKKLQKVLLLEHFTPLELEYKKGEGSECQFYYPYQTITVRYNDKLINDFKNKNYKHVTSILAHEMCHPLTDGLYAKASSTYRNKDEIGDERERLTDHIANIILKNDLL